MKSVRFPIVSSDSQMDRTITHGSLTLIMDTSFRPEHHRRQFGYMTCDWKDIVKKGEKVYFHYLSLETTPQIPPNNWLIHNDMLYCVIRDEKIIPLNDYLFVKIVKEEQPKSSLIQLKPKDSTTTGIVRYTNHPELTPGDVVMFSELCAFQNEIEGETLYVMENKDVLCKIIKS